MRIKAMFLVRLRHSSPIPTAAFGECHARHRNSVYFYQRPGKRLEISVSAGRRKWFARKYLNKNLQEGK